MSSTFLRAGVPCIAMSPDWFFPLLLSECLTNPLHWGLVFFLSLLDQHQSPVLLFCCLNLLDQSIDLRWQGRVWEPWWQLWGLTMAQHVCPKPRTAKCIEGLSRPGLFWGYIRCLTDRDAYEAQTRQLHKAIEAVMFTSDQCRVI